MRRTLASHGGAGESAWTYTARWLSAATTYRFRVRALNGWGTSDWSVLTVNTAAPAAAPAAPSGLTAALHASDTTPPYQYDLFWTDNSTDEDGFATQAISPAAPLSDVPSGWIEFGAGDTGQQDFNLSDGSHFSADRWCLWPGGVTISVMAFKDTGAPGGRVYSAPSNTSWTQPTDVAAPTYLSVSAGGSSYSLDWFWPGQGDDHFHLVLV